MLSLSYIELYKHFPNKNNQANKKNTKNHKNRSINQKPRKLKASFSAHGRVPTEHSGTA